MSRLTRPVTVNENPNPAKKFLHWKSNDQCFEWFNKELKNEKCKGKVKVELPLKVLFLEHYHTVKGWSDSANSGIWSNEVFSTISEEIEVRNANGVIVKGIYNQNKATINNAGGKYHRSVYCMTEDGEIINLQLKGSAVGGIAEDKSVDGKLHLGWNAFHSGDKKKKIKGHSHLMDNQWIEINGVAEGKSGAVKYCIPKFEMGEVISRETYALANEAAARLQAYMDVYFDKEKEVEQELEPVANLDDLDF